MFYKMFAPTLTKSIIKAAKETTMYNTFPPLTPKYIPKQEKTAIITLTTKYGDVK